MLGVFVVLFHVSSKKQPEADEQKQVNEYLTSQAQWEGKYPPDFEIELMEGKQHFKLSEEIGTKLIVLNFFATWCGPCRREMPELVSYQKANRNAPFLLVGIDAREDGDTVRKFMDEYHISYPVGIDHTGSITRRYKVKGFPTTVVIGVDGRVKAYTVGPVANANVAFDHLLDEAREAIDSGEAITAEAYLDALQLQDPQAVSTQAGEKAGQEDEKKPEVELTGRAAMIAEEMLCPCGCSDQVADCTCGTAKKIKQRLGTMDFTGRTDREIIRELNAEFCVGNDKSG